MTKTLFQRMETELDSNLYLCHNFNEIEKKFLILTKEWLQDIQTFMIPWGNLENKAKVDFIDALIERIGFPTNESHESKEGT